MHTVVIRIPRLELSAQMAVMCKWLAKHGCDPSLFTSKRDGNIVSVYVQFKNDSEADTFRARFKDQEQRLESDAVPLLLDEWRWSLNFLDDLSAKNRGAMERVCWWRLKAEEVRTQAEVFSCADARDTMKTVAETWDRMAEDLERRLARE